jgi:hypothetical protein
VAAELSPRLGDVLAVGRIIGRVVRVFPEGFAIRFIGLQDHNTLKTSTGRPTSRRSPKRRTEVRFIEG